MSTFTVRVVPVQVETHPNADLLEVARIGDFHSVIRKGSFQTGELVAYLPEAAVLPLKVLQKLGLAGKLAGAQRNRIRACKLRGVLSQGICYPVEPDWEEGQDVAEILGIIKYVPPIPASLGGQVWPVGLEWTWDYDIENVKRWPDVLIEGEPVVFTEKIHGTWACFAVIPGEDGPVLVVASKGLFAKGLAFKDVPENDTNIYIRVARHIQAKLKILEHFGNMILDMGLAIYAIGEIFGIQDLKYGANPNRDETLGFRVFDIYVGIPGRGDFANDRNLERLCGLLGWPRVPVLYKGPFSKAKMLEITEGRETVSGQELHMREGIVISLRDERTHPELGRVKLKSVSAAYLTRKGKKGVELTEFE